MAKANKAGKSSMIVGGAALPNMPWQDRPAGNSRVIWRYNANPIITRDVVQCANSIFNSAVVPFGGKFAGVFRVDDRRRYSHIHVGHSDDGLTWPHIQRMVLWFFGVMKLMLYLWVMACVWLTIWARKLKRVN